MTKYNTDKEFISKFAKNADIVYELADYYIEKMVDAARDSIYRNGTLTVRRLGTFHLSIRKKAKYRNIQTGEIKIIPMIYVIRFQPAHSLKNLVNKKVRDSIKND